MEAAVNRLLSFPHQEPATVAGKIRFGDRLVRAIRSSSILGASTRPLAAGYLRSINPIALFAQDVFGALGMRRAERLAWEFRLGWRQWFEDKLNTLARDRIMADVEAVLRFYADMGYLLPRNSKDRLWARLINALSEDENLTAAMASLQKLPIGRHSFQQRLRAVDAAVEKHLAVLAHSMVMGHFARVVHGGLE